MIWCQEISGFGLNYWMGVWGQARNFPGVPGGSGSFIEAVV